MHAQFKVKIVGFTGTQAGMSENQKMLWQRFLLEHGVEEVHHGDCIGADAEADAIAADLGIRRAAHPCMIPGKRAYCKAEIIFEPTRSPHTRNRIIVDTGAVLVAAPLAAEIIRSGTWSTVRYARRQAVLPIILPRARELR